ncbi:formate dehydrogenase accessory protein FdhE [Ramlibacter rhizophilus]|uniref:Formate dehydrogenase accessory protein FdhE n=1 Tax=Ramlibacter rhizophilus TaxID=1781167 RepID=A0A4Z0BGM5_9BURK|nr:formate dehydrogenase accessory protein FdhE [Ramlibacter rhizophilus]TFY98465.1 formate dehydrogenase accessory protein FdhE [Ramlibacter rhizophilus]
MSAAAASPRRPAGAVARLDALAQVHAEWVPWLRVVRELLPALSDPAWDAGPPVLAPGVEWAPRLAGAGLRPDAGALAQLLQRLFGVAHAQGLHALTGTSAGAHDALAEEALAVFLASINHDPAALDLQASRVGATPEGWRTLARLLPMPYLHACGRGWAAEPDPIWSQGYCPVCGAWPAFAELRGIERTRHLRCGRCGTGWPMAILACTYCGTTDHDTLGTLVVEGQTSKFAAETCSGCSGYLKTCTTLQATPPDEIMVTDLESVEFDLAAVERGFLRPPEPGFALDASLADLAAPPAMPRPQ